MYDDIPLMWLLQSDNRDISRRGWQGYNLLEGLVGPFFSPWKKMKQMGGVIGFLEKCYKKFI